MVSREEWARKWGKNQGKRGHLGKKMINIRVAKSGEKCYYIDLKTKSAVKEDVPIKQGLKRKVTAYRASYMKS